MEQTIDDHVNTDNEQHEADDEALHGKGFGQKSGSDADGDNNSTIPGKEPGTTLTKVVLQPGG